MRNFFLLYPIDIIPRTHGYSLKRVLAYQE